MAMQITVTLPSALSNLSKDEQEILIRAGLREAAAARVRQIADEIAEAGEMIQRYEARYGVTLAQFEIEQLQGLEGVQLHEDYNDWFYWTQVWNEKRQLLNDLENGGITTSLD